MQFAPGYQPTVGVDYGFKIETVSNEEGKLISYNGSCYDTEFAFTSDTWINMSRREYLVLAPNLLY